MLAKAPREFWLKKLPANTPDVSALARPLLDDLLAAESWMEIRGPNQRLEGVLAIQLMTSGRACGIPICGNGCGPGNWELPPPPRWMGLPDGSLKSMTRPTSSNVCAPASGSWSGWERTS